MMLTDEGALFPRRPATRKQIQIFIGLTQFATMNSSPMDTRGQINLTCASELELECVPFKLLSSCFNLNSPAKLVAGRVRPDEERVHTLLLLLLFCRCLLVIVSRCS